MARDERPWTWSEVVFLVTMLSPHVEDTRVQVDGRNVIGMHLRRCGNEVLMNLLTEQPAADEEGDGDGA